MKIRKLRELIKLLFFYKDVEPKYSFDEQCYLETVKKCLSLIENDSLTILDARQFMIRLPTHYSKHGRYKEDVHEICNDCHKKLYEYCKKKGLIEDIDYEEFTENGLIHFVHNEGTESLWRTYGM